MIQLEEIETKMGPEEWSGDRCHSRCHGVMPWSYLWNLKCSRAGDVGVMPSQCKWRMALPLTDTWGAQATFYSLLISGMSGGGSLVLCSSVNRDEIALPCDHLHEKKGFGLISSLLRK